MHGWLRRRGSPFQRPFRLEAKQMKQDSVDSEEMRSRRQGATGRCRMEELNVLECKANGDPSQLPQDSAA